MLPLAAIPDLCLPNSWNTNCNTNHINAGSDSCGFSLVLACIQHIAPNQSELSTILGAGMDRSAVRQQGLQTALLHRQLMHCCSRFGILTELRHSATSNTTSTKQSIHGRASCADPAVASLTPAACGTLCTLCLLCMQQVSSCYSTCRNVLRSE